MLSDAKHFTQLPQGFRGFEEAGIVSVFGAVCDDRAAIFIHGLKSLVFLAAWVCAMGTQDVENTKDSGGIKQVVPTQRVLRQRVVPIDF